MNKSLPIIFFCFLLAPFAVRAAASDVDVTPLVIDDEAKPGDMLEYVVKIKNIAEPYKATFYPSIYDVATVRGKQEIVAFSSDSDRSSHLSRWMEFSRGMIALMPGEESALPVKITIKSDAMPGIYHADLVFAEGPDRADAENAAKTEVQPKMTFNINVKGNVVEKVEAVSFRTDRQIYFSSPAKIILEVKNIGNQDIIPGGSIFIYNRREQELSQLAINQEAKAVKPGESGDFSMDWPISDGLGMYKAKLEMDYGNSEDKKNLQDTIYFWALPWKYLLFFGAGFSIMIAAYVTMFNRRKLAYQGLAADEDVFVDAEADEEAAGVINLRRR